MLPRGLLWTGVRFSAPPPNMSGITAEARARRNTRRALARARLVRVTAKNDTYYGMAPEMWESTRERARQFLIGCARDRRTTTYSEIAEVVAPAHVPPYSYAMMRLLNDICSREDAASGVMLASLVCTKATGMPGEGYFGCAQQLMRDTADRSAFWQAECDRVYAAFAEVE